MFKNLTGGLGGLGDMAKMMARAQEMQQRMAEMQERLETIEVEGEAGAGAVRATCTAKGVLTGIAIDPEILKPEEQAVVQDLVVAAVALAQAKAQDRAKEEMAALAAEMGLPAGMLPG